jgi:hypothetical protein
MPEYLAPGVYIEEVSFRSKTIEGVGTAIAGFVGPTRFGPTEGEPEMLTSFPDFERIYGGLDPLNYEGASQAMVNYLAQAVRAFFEEGGSRLYVTRVYQSRAGENEGATDRADNYADGIARATIQTDSPPDAINLQARYPGSGGNVDVTFTVRPSKNVLTSVPTGSNGTEAAVQGIADYDMLWIDQLASPTDVPPALYYAREEYDETLSRKVWRFYDDSGTPISVLDLDPAVDKVRILQIDVQIDFPGRFPRTELWENLAFHPEHRRALSRTYSPMLNNRLQQLTVPIIVDAGALTGPELTSVLLGQQAPTRTATIMEEIDDDTLSSADRQFTVPLRGGNDGYRPDAEEYEGRGSDDPDRTSGLKSLEAITHITMVAAPGSTYGYNNGYQNDANQIARLLISHCERMRYRIAVLDAPNGLALSSIQDFRAQFDSKHAALYYPWIKILDPISNEETGVPPSGQICGIYARNDTEHGVHKAPANEVIRTALSLEFLLNKAQQDVLNPQAINCLRFFPNRGFRVWGARIMTSDPEWKYVNLRRYFAYLEHSIELGTQWAVFENNGPELWANVRRTIEDFLFNEWQSGHLLGASPEEAYFVRCDRSTMTQNDLDNGRMICLIGVAPLRPAEFVIFRIGQWTADAG